MGKVVVIDEKGMAAEEVLPNMVLRVLLVEPDDSTRQIIAALLRKCCCKVTAVSDGLMAWETLKGRRNNFDLILTEVELPSISGYALLTLAMEHDFCKNIPVIMMSSNDSINMVLKCMLKGAADFLIKPVRRNELRNLWQHVWRRRTLPSGCISLNSSILLHKIEATSEINKECNNFSDCSTLTQKNRIVSVKESDIRGIMNIDPSNVVFTYGGLSELKSKSSLLLSNTRKEMFEEQAKLQITSADSECKTREGSNQSELACDEAYDLTVLRIGEEHGSTRKTLQSERSNQSELACDEANDSTALRLGEEHGSTMEPPQNERLRPESDKKCAESCYCNNGELIEPSAGAVDLITKFGDNSTGTSEHSGLNVCTNKYEFIPELEISLGRYCPSSLNDLPMDENHALNHSNSSAFSWYNSKILQPLFPLSTCNGFGFEKDASKSSELSSNQLSQNSSGISHQRGSTGSNNQEVMNSPASGSGQADIYPGPGHGFSPVQGVKLDNFCIGYDHVFPSLHYTQLGLSPTWTSKVAGEREQFPFHTNTSFHSNHDVDDPKHHYRQSDDTTSNSADQNICQQKMELMEELKHGLPASYQNASSILFGGFTNYDSKSTHEIFYHRNHANARLAVADERATKSERLKDSPLFIREGFRGMNPHRSSPREAALTKFRLKRKDHSYEKKVPYQSRKRLADQRS